MVIPGYQLTRRPSPPTLIRVILRRFVRSFLVSCLLLLAVQPGRASRAAPVIQSNYTLIAEPTTGGDPLIKLISMAKISILVETRALNDPAVAGALSAARGRGVDVRVMVDPHSASSGSVLGSLAAADVWTRRGNPAFNLTDQSAAVIDGTTLAMSNAPLTIDARTTQRRFLLVDFEPQDVLQATTVFYDDWERRDPSIFGDNTVLGPENYATSVIAAINHAGYALDIMAGTLTSTDVARTIADAARRKVKVRVLFDPGVPSSVVQSLQLSGAVVRLLNKGFAGSAISIDNIRLLLGSAPLTDIALQQNRELGLLVKNGGVSSVFASTFDAEWRAAAPIAAPTAIPTATIQPTATMRPTATATPKGYHPTRTPTPRPSSPTPRPTRVRPTRTPMPTATPAPTATPNALTLGVSYAASVRIGSKQQIIVHTIARASVSIIVTYPDGTVTNPGTRAGIADATGAFVDSWPISLTTVPGPAKASIVVNGIGLRKSELITFRITF